MTYALRLGGRARRELARLPHDVITRIDKAITALAENPRPPGCKKLRSKTPEGWRVRVGVYRVLYQLDDARREVTVYRIAHRRDVYN